jgi:hypothetical protein
LFESIFMQSYMNKHVGITLPVFLLVLYTGARGTDHPSFSNFLFTNLFSIEFLYFFIISSLFPYFNLFVSIFIIWHWKKTIKPQALSVYKFIFNKISLLFHLFFLILKFVRVNIHAILCKHQIACVDPISIYYMVDTCNLMLA